MHPTARKRGAVAVFPSLAAVTALASLTAIAGCGEKSEPPVTAPPPPTATAAPDPGRSPTGERPSENSENRDPAARAEAQRREAERVVRAYLRALDDRDGAAVCRLFAPGVLDKLHLPRGRATCAASLNASIGYRDPRGLPVFEGVSLAQIASVKANARTARVTATVVTNFADRDEPSIEDDIVYMKRRGGSYLIAKPSAALYRAIGAEPPLRSVVPPG